VPALPPATAHFTVAPVPAVAPLRVTTKVTSVASSSTSVVAAASAITPPSSSSLTVITALRARPSAAPIGDFKRR